MAGAAFGEVHVSLLVAGAAFGEIWNDSWCGKRCNFQKNLLQASVKSSLGGAAGCGLRFLGRNGLGAWSDRSRIGNDVLPVFSKFLSDVGWSFCVAGAVFGEIGG